jgi:hypothetical protein
MAGSGKSTAAVKLNGRWGAIRWSEDLTFLEFDPAEPNTKARAREMAAANQHDYGDESGTLKFER